MALRGVKKSVEHRAKLAAANTGKKHSAETRAKWFDSRSQRKAELFRRLHPETPLIVATGPILKLMEA